MFSQVDRTNRAGLYWLFRVMRVLISWDMRIYFDFSPTSEKVCVSLLSSQSYPVNWSNFCLHSEWEKTLCKAFMFKEHSETTRTFSVLIAKGFWQPVPQSKTRLQYRTPSKQAKYWLVKMHCKPHNITGKIPSLWPNVVLCLIVIVVSHAHCWQSANNRAILLFVSDKKNKSATTKSDYLLSSWFYA